MKKVLLILLLLVSFTSVAQESKSFEETLTPYVEKILNGIEQGVEFAQEEIPIVLQQYVMYEAVFSWLLILISFIILFISLKIGNILNNKAKKENFYGEKEKYVVGRVFSYVGGIFTFLLLFFVNISTAIQATFFPKLFLVKEFLNHI